MRRRDFLAGASGAAIAAVVAPKTIEWMNREEFVRRAMDEIVGYAIGRPALAADLPPSQDSQYVWPVAYAYLQMMSAAEGTLESRVPDPYRVLVGHHELPPDEKVWSRHPEYRVRDGELRVPGYPIPVGNGLVSYAAGAYQFIGPTWQSVRHERGFDFFNNALGDFAPENQDLAALALHGLTGGHGHLRASMRRADNGHLWIDHDVWLRAVRADSNQWASFKGANIGASTGQSVRPDWWMWTQFIWGLWRTSGKQRHVLFPCEGYGMKNISDRMRWRSRHPVSGGGRMHWGTDVAVPAGTPILAPEGGTVVMKEELGFSFVPEKDPGLRLRYFHCRVNDAVLDKWVPQGEKIGVIGPKDRYSTGPHLHLEAFQFGKLIDSWYYLGMSEWFKPV